MALLDLVVLRYVQWDFDDIWCGEHKEGFRAYCHPDTFKAIAPLVFHNDGNGKFTEVAAKLGLECARAKDWASPSPITTMTATSISSSPTIPCPSFCITTKATVPSKRKGLFSQVAVDEDGRTFAGMGTDFADLDNDGWPDLIVSDLANQMYALFKNNGDGSFNYSTKSSGMGRMTMLHSGWGLRAFDYDNDGWKDLLIAQGHDLDTIELTNPQLRYKEPLLLARNTGHGFVDVSANSGAIFHEAWAGRGLAIGDLNNDGRVDAVVATNDGPPHVLRNDTINGNHWIILKLTGHKSNRDAIGALVKVTTAQGSQTVTVSTASSYLSSSDKRAHFGLGKETAIPLIEIHWPSGIVQQIKNTKADQILSVDEPEH